jgi:hypothetical protein
MKKIIITVMLAISASFVFGQRLLLRADTIDMYKVGGSANLRIQNPTKNRTGAALKNIGDGMTRFDTTFRFVIAGRNYDIAIKRHFDIDSFSIENPAVSGDSLWTELEAKRYAIKRLEFVDGDNITITPDHSAGRLRYIINGTGGGTGDSVIASIGAKIARVGKDVTVSTNTPAFRSLAEMRAVPAAFLDTGSVYWRNTYGLLVPYKWVDTSTRADDSATSIQRTGSPVGRFLLYHEHAIPAMAFGIDPTGLTDCSYQMQKAVNYTVNETLNDKAAYLKIPGGTFQVKNIFIHKFSAPGEYYFVTCTIEGAAPVHDVSSALGRITTFVNYDGNSFTLGMQKARNVFIRNIAFIGASPTPGDYKNIIEWTDLQWITGVRDNINSPHAGIVIDPFHANTLSGNRYPGQDGRYSNSQGGGSSEIVIEGCAIRHFVAGVLISPNGTTQNCDNIVFRDGSAYGNKNFWASGQNQSRANAIINLYSFGGTQCLVNCVDYGMQQGSAPNLVESNIAGGHKYVYRMNGSFAGMNIDKTYFESLWSLGVSGDMPVTFTGSQVVWNWNEITDTYMPPVFAEGKSINFIGGSVEFFDNQWCHAMPFNVQQLHFTGTKLRSGIPFNRQYWQGRVTFKEVDFTNSEGVGRLDEGTQVSQSEISNTVYAPALPGMKFRFGETEMEALNEKFEFLYTETATLEIDATTKKGYFLSDEPGRYKVRDALVQEGVTENWTNDIYSATQTTLGWVYEISGDTVKIKYMPYGLVDGVSRGISIARIPRFLPRVIGDINDGSVTVTNVQTWGGTLQEGNRLRGPGIAPGTYITAIGAGTITLSIPATATATNQFFYDAKMRLTHRGSDVPSGAGMIIYPGDITEIEPLNTGAAADSIARKIAVVAGINGGTPAPLWRSLKYNVGGAGGVSQSLDDVLTVGNTTTQDMSTGNIIVQSTYGIRSPVFHTNFGNDVGMFASGNDIHFKGGGSPWVTMEYFGNITMMKTLNIYDVNGSTNHEFKMTQNNSSELFAFKPYTNNGNGSKIYKFSSYYNLTDMGTYLATFENQNVIKTFVRPNGHFKYVNPDDTFDDSTLVPKKYVDDIVAALNIADNTFTATLFNGTNVASSVFRGARYMRVGNHVSVSITVDIETSGAGASQIDFSLPVATDFANRYSLDGSGSNGSISATVFGDATNDRAIVNFAASGSGTTVWTFKFQYTIIAP